VAQGQVPPTRLCRAPGLRGSDISSSYIYPGLGYLEIRALETLSSTAEVTCDFIKEVRASPHHHDIGLRRETRSLCIPLPYFTRLRASTTAQTEGYLPRVSL
jgi:hypothetical protein